MNIIVVHIVKLIPYSYDTRRSVSYRFDGDFVLVMGTEIFSETLVVQNQLKRQIAREGFINSVLT
jgi:hypothetical protein